MLDMSLSGYASKFVWLGLKLVCLVMLVTLTSYACNEFVWLC